LLVFDLASSAIRDKKPIPGFTADALDFDLVDVDAAQAERVRESVEESKSVLGMRVHDGPIGRKLIVEANLDGREQAAQLLVHALYSLRQEALQPLPRLLRRAGCQHPDESLQFLLELALLRVIECGAGLEADVENIHDLARQYLRGSDLRRTPRRAPGRGPGGRTREGIDLPRADVQAEGRQQAAKDGELRKVIEPDDDDVEFGFLGRRDATFGR